MELYERTNGPWKSDRGFPRGKFMIPTFLVENQGSEVIPAGAAPDKDPDRNKMAAMSFGYRRFDRRC
ncbi:MAG: hypothetical protein U0350_39615 [Caldilineaceae bacterium]